MGLPRVPKEKRKQKIARGASRTPRRFPARFGPLTRAGLEPMSQLQGINPQYAREVRIMGSAGIDFNVAFAAFVKWLSVTFGGGIGIS
ncbi:MAG: hypothetical protein K0Q46_2698 [Rhodococcus erythropolis]|jgi:hypothetical protein|uniref:hypothetical protein n=1 Tax=Rhodococcus qingshengii TaxID=334542 RepID=UPI0024312A34|nr:MULTISPECIES: hypothetical protein [Rhodococcus erythropolis group]MDF2895912.1 hypothetical protein [Rhodococcus erythropolis]MDT9664729.1 hypothetical protein [Rhodococcus qingshengii]